MKFWVLLGIFGAWGLLSLMEIDACLQALKRKTHDALDKSKLGIYQSL